jgi:hypothetical protein
MGPPAFQLMKPLRGEPHPEQPMRARCLSKGPGASQTGAFPPPTPPGLARSAATDFPGSLESLRRRGKGSSPWGRSRPVPVTPGHGRLGLGIARSVGSSSSAHSRAISPRSPAAPAGPPPPPSILPCRTPRAGRRGPSAPGRTSSRTRFPLSARGSCNLSWSYASNLLAFLRRYTDLPGGHHRGGHNPSPLKVGNLVVAIH